MTHLEHQTLRLTSLVQDYHPVNRRRAYTSIRSSFPTFFAPEVEPSLLLMNESQKIISQHFSKINNIIDLVDDHIRRRIQCYENEVVSVVQNQIQQMRQQTHKVVAQFNSMIQQKNKENQIYSLNNELDYFKSEAKKLFDHNRKLRKQNAEMLKKFKEYQLELENREVIMQKLWYKYQKEKHHKGKLKTMMDEELQSIQKSASQKRKQSKPEIMEFSLKDDAFDFDQMPELKLNSIKSIQAFKEIKKLSLIQEKSDKGEKPALQNSVNSLLQIDYQDESEISKIQFKGKSLSLYQVKPQMKDQQSQVNIFLSEHTYKSLFDKKVSNKRLLKLGKPFQQIAIQTENVQKGQVSYKLENEISLSSPKKSRDINFVRNGFYVNDVQNSNPKNQHYRSTSTNHNTTKRDTFYKFKDKKARMTTQTGFTKPHNGQEDIHLVTQNSGKFQNKIYCKMAKRLQRNKIVQRAYDKLTKSIQK